MNSNNHVPETYHVYCLIASNSRYYWKPSSHSLEYIWFSTIQLFPFYDYIYSIFIESKCLTIKCYSEFPLDMRVPQHHVPPRLSMQLPFLPKTIRDPGATLCKFHTRAILRKRSRWQDVFNPGVTTWTAGVSRHPVGSVYSWPRYSTRMLRTT